MFLFYIQIRQRIQYVTRRRAIQEIRFNLFRSQFICLECQKRARERDREDLGAFMITLVGGNVLSHTYILFKISVPVKEWKQGWKPDDLRSWKRLMADFVCVLPSTLSSFTLNWTSISASLFYFHSISILL